MNSKPKRVDKIDWPSKKLTIIRGLPGSGKSTLARQMAKEFGNCPVIEADQFRYLTPNEYHYNPKLNGVAAQWALTETLRQLQTHDHVINTGVYFQIAHIMPYIEWSVKLDFMINIIQADTPWMDDVDKCVDKTLHSVPKKHIERFNREWERLEGWQLDSLIRSCQDQNCHTVWWKSMKGYNHGAT
jgi:predicted kinase